MKTKLTIYLIALVLVLGCVGAVRGQGNREQQRELCRLEMQRTDDLIAEARMAVKNSESALAAKALERADQLQAGARKAFASDALILTVSLTRKAREQASAAISTSRMAEQLEGVLNGRLERAQENLDQVHDELGTPLNPTASALYDQARNFLAQAWEFFRGRRFLAAGKMVEQVEQATRRLRTLARNGQGGNAEAFELRLDNVQRLVEYAQEILADCGSKTGREQLGRAEQSLQRARDLRAQNQNWPALSALGNARQAARKAVRECRDGSFLEQRYQRLVKELDQAKTRLADADREHGSTTASELLQKASEQLDLAGRYLAANETESALLSLQAAQIALRQAERYLNGER